MKEIQDLNHKVAVWAKGKFLQIAIFNILLITLFLLRSAGYFEPYFLISVNFIIIIGLLSAIPLFGAGSGTFFTSALIFWLFASLLRILNLDVWAERTAVYTYESLVIGVMLIIFEYFKDRLKKLK